ncbi:hypothetical protein NQ314_008181 [Rhamnusium bicolor]|uniref:U1-type domain-containing protein n=1 Tax=Rhamnusium bicolor TaxID=1586634 RepID=A0AAV8YE51_9CUCU|nr:hypothetical protein NQ314_008181 [Rhamnusium bicolor]
MPKTSSWIKNVPELELSGNKVFCKACAKIIVCEKKFQVDQHLKTSIHKAKLQKIIFLAKFNPSRKVLRVFAAAAPYMAPLRVQMYMERLPGVSLPLEPVITRWGTWIKAAIFYAEHFEAIKELILDIEDNSQRVVQSQLMLKCKCS